MINRESLEEENFEIECEGIKRLMLDLLKSVYKNTTGGPPRNCPDSHRKFDLNWLEGGIGYPFDLETVCDFVGINPEYYREQIYKRFQKDK